MSLKNIPSVLPVYKAKGTRGGDGRPRAFGGNGLRAESLRYIGSYPHTAKELLMLGFAVRVKKAPFFLSKEVDAAAWYSPEDALTAVKPGGAGQSLVGDCVERDGAGNLHFLKV